MSTKNNTYRENLIKLAKAKFELQLRKQVYPNRFFKPLSHQVAFHQSIKKDKAIFGGNRSGKTINGAEYVIQKCLTIPKFNARASTWADLSVPIQQTKVYELLPKDGSVQFRYSEKDGFYRNIIIFKKTNALLRFKTYEQGWKTFQGASLDLEWNDEEAPEAIIKEQRARLIDRAGTLLRTMTPLNGITYTYDEIILNEKNNPEVEYWFWNSSDNIYINQEALINTIAQFADKEAEVRSTGHFLNLTTGNAYYAFNESNIIDEYEVMDYRPLEISCDFNIDLMCWNISQEKQGKDFIFDSVELENQANTDLLCQMLKSKYPNHRGGYVFYGDIAGNQRHPETSRTNWSIIREHFPDSEFNYQAIRNIKDRVDATNGRMKNQSGNYCYVLRSCKRLIKDLRQVTWEMLLNKNKADRLTHASDGLSYQLFWKYPLTGKVSVSRGLYA